MLARAIVIIFLLHESKMSSVTHLHTQLLLQPRGQEYPQLPFKMTNFIG